MNDKDNSNSGWEDIFAAIITKAQQGDCTSMGQLVEVAEPRLLTYIFRLTLSQDLSEELCQKTLVKMVQSLETLKNVNQFWYWLLRHAMSEVQHYYRDQKRRHEVEFEALNREYFKQYVARNHYDGLFGKYCIFECRCHSGGSRVAGDETGYYNYYLNQCDFSCYYFPAFAYINIHNSNDFIRTDHCRLVFRP